MKKFLAILLALTAVLGLFAGCGGTGGAGSSGEDVTADGKTVLSIGIAPNAKVMDLNNNAMTKWVEEQLNVELKFVEFAGGTDVATQISTTVAARQPLPDILFAMGLGTGVVSTYGKDGYFVDLAPYFEDKEGASKIFWDRMNENFTEQEVEDILLRMTDGDTGGIYGTPTMETSLVDSIKGQAWINVQWLDALNLEKPTNTEELVTVLKAFRDNDCNGNGDPNDEIPLYGSQKTSSGGRVLDWLFNLYLYYDEDHRWQFYNNSEELEFVYTQDKYREALQFAKMLYDEKLLNPLIWSSSANEMKTITTPASGTALCGMFFAHLTTSAAMGNEVLYQYEPLKTWGCAVERDTTFNLNTYITADCADAGKTDKAFELLMLLFSEEGYMRLRYGEYGVNWVDADEGAVSDYGLPATYKLLSDPLTQQTTAWWGKIASTLGIYAEGETAQTNEGLDEWTQKKSLMHAEQRKLFDEAAAANNPEVLCPTLVTTTEEKEASEMQRTNVASYVTQRQVDFIKGENGWDINDDADWAAYLKEMNDLGLDVYSNYINTAYDRQ